MAEQSDSCNGETLLAPCVKKKLKKLQRKMAKEYYWIGIEKSTGMFRKS